MKKEKVAVAVSLSVMLLCVLVVASSMIVVQYCVCGRRNLKPKLGFDGFCGLWFTYCNWVDRQYRAISYGTDVFCPIHEVVLQ